MSKSVGLRICEALGLNPSGVLEMTIKVTPAVTTVDIRSFISGDGAEIIEEFKSMKLVPAESGPEQK